MKMRFAMLGLVMAAGAAQAELVVNGGFEAGTTWPPTGWTSVNQGSFSGLNGGGGSAHTGTNWVYMGATSAATQTDFYQDIPTTIGAQYTASFWAYDVDPASSGFIHVTFGGVDIGPASGTVPHTYTQYSLVFTATAATTRLEATGWEASQYVISDDYSVVPVPAPGSLALLGLGGLFAGRRRR